MELIWRDRADSIEAEVCQALAVKELREYFRKPTTKEASGTNIYPVTLRAAAKHRFIGYCNPRRRTTEFGSTTTNSDKDMLFKALVNYVEPRIRLESVHGEALRNQKMAAGNSGKEAKQLAKELERQEDFLSELRDFGRQIASSGEPCIWCARPERWCSPEYRSAVGTGPVEGGEELLGGTPRRQIRVVVDQPAASPERFGEVMALVTESLFQLIAKQVDEKSLVVWYDPEQAYSEAAAELSFPNTTVARYEGSFLKP